ncbi:MAG: HlyD family efflux transporter periplasmic adaptor subunit [Opitutaceae bacterium]
MTPTSQPSLSAQVQRVATEISARLAQIAKDPPELAAYLRLHAECVIQTLQPVGLSYEMATGQNFQRTLTHNYESLKLRDSPAQELAFQRAVRSTAEQGKAVVLEANTVAGADSMHGLQPDDAPAPETLAPHNQTPYQQVFVPIPLSKKVAGVVHAWFAPADATAGRARVAVLAHAASEVELYLKARRISDISQELSRINTYARFLEDVAGDQDLEAVSWKLVNYAREAVGCDRVCLFVDSRYGLAPTKELPPLDRLTLQACSGLRKPHPRSEHAEVLKAHASELLKFAVGLTTAAEPEMEGPKAPAPAGEPPTNGSGENKESAPPAPARPVTDGASVDGRPKMRIILTNRDPAKTASRPDAVNRYFDIIPMNWSTVLPLYDHSNRVCGTLLFEGQQTNDKMGALFMQMRDLAVSGGRALSTALVWHRRRTLRGARVLMGWRDQLLATSKRRLFVKYGLPAILAIGLLAYPFPHRIRGDVTVRPVSVHTVAALTSGRLTEVAVREGDRVKKGQVLCRLDTTDLNHLLLQTIQEHERAITEADISLRLRRDEGMRQLEMIKAAGAALREEKIKRDISLAVIVAPFDGVVVGPQDLSQRTGQIIRVGETVAEIVDPAHWEVKVSVREQDVPKLIAEVKARRAKDPTASVGGELVLTANPNRIYHLNLADPTSFAHRLDTSGGKYNFSSIIRLSEGLGDPAQLTPEGELKLGYTGRVRFLCGRQPLAQILFGDFIRFLKLSLF